MPACRVGVLDGGLCAGRADDGQKDVKWEGGYVRVGILSWGISRPGPYVQGNAPVNCCLALRVAGEMPLFVHNRGPANPGHLVCPRSH